MKTEKRRISYLAMILSIIYSTSLNIIKKKNKNQQEEGISRVLSIILPLRPSNLINLILNIIFESFFISQLSLSKLASFGACLHLLKIPLLSTTYNYFNVGFKNEICKSLSFDLINYMGQFLLFYLFSKNSDKKKTPDETKIIQEETNEIIKEKEIIIELKETNENLKIKKVKKRKENIIFMSLLIWILISLMDGIFNFIFEKNLSPKIQFDVKEYTNKIQLDEYFLLDSTKATMKPTEILRSIPPKDRSMIEHQIISPIINLPYFFSSASLISLPSDFILLDKLPMLSFNTKLHWLFGLIIRRFLNSTLAYFLKS